MKNACLSVIILSAVAALAVPAASLRAEITVTMDHNGNDDAGPSFHFPHVPAPAKSGALRGRFEIIDGEADSNSGGLEKLNDGQTPTEQDQPDENFFFDAGTDGGRLRLDLNGVATITQIDTYSWHGGSRAPQAYKLYGATGTNEGFRPRPKRGVDPVSCGWTLLANVDTRPKDGPSGGQYGVSIRDNSGPLGSFRYLLFDCSQTEKNDDFGNTFYSEISVLGTGGAGSSGTASETNPPEVKPIVAHTPDGKYEITIDVSRAPELTDWASNTLAPTLIEWYPKIIAYLPSQGYQAPKHYTVTLRPGRGVAATSGTRVTANSLWIGGELKRQAVGSLIHESVHVVQQYGRARRNNPDATDNPGYLVEGIADYYRWFKFEPQSKGAEISKRGFERARYDGSYRITANFLNWVSGKYDKDLVPQLNAAMREGKYSTNIWSQNTGKTVLQLNTEWKEDLKKQLGL